jgi:acyl dehydratase
MAYTIVKSDGTVLTTIADGTINTTSTSLGLPGRNYAGYGQQIDTNFVHQVENFAASTPPANPLRGQLWYDINNSILKLCPTDGTTNASAWITLAVSSGTSTTTFGSVNVTGNLTANNITAVNAIVGDTITVRLATVTANATIANAAITTANVGTLNSAVINAGSANTTAGALTGTWTANGGSGGNTFIVTNGNLVAVTGIKTNNYYYANGDPFNPTGTYTNANVFDYLTGSNSVTQFSGNIAPGRVQTSNISTGGNTTSGSITGNWALTTGSRLLSTYADLAERFEADAIYDAGTVVEMGGDKEITAVQYELSDDVFGVVSTTAGYLMNAMAGDDETHPAIAVGGRVQVKVTGKVRKGQRLVSAGKGIARAAKPGEATSFNVIGRALEHKTTDELGVVEAFVKIN